MKYILPILFLCLVAVNAENFFNLMPSVHQILSKASQIYKEAADTLKHKIDQSFSNRKNYIKVAMKTIEDLRKINETCVNAESKQLLSTLDIFNTSMQACRDMAANKSNNILEDITLLNEHLKTVGRELKRSCLNCRENANVLLTIRTNCDMFIKPKLNKYLEDSRKSLKEIEYRTKQRMYNIVTEVDSCSYNPFIDCIYDLARIQNTIENCIAKSKLK